MFKLKNISNSMPLLQNLASYLKLKRKTEIEVDVNITAAAL